MTVASWLPHPTRGGVIRDCLPGGEFANLLFSYFNGSNKGIICGEAKMRDFKVKCVERP